jgi:predicted dehydrogenase
VRVLGPRVSVASIRFRRGVLRIELAADEGRRGRIVAWPAPSEARRWWTPSGRPTRSRSREPDPLAAQWRAFESLVLGAAPTQGEPANAEGARSVWRLLDAARAHLAARTG